MSRMAGGEKVFEQRIKRDIGCHQLGLHRHLASQVNVSVERKLGVGELGTSYQLEIGPIGNAEDIEIADALSIHHQVVQAERGVDDGASAVPEPCASNLSAPWICNQRACNWLRRAS